MLKIVCISIVTPIFVYLTFHFGRLLPTKRTRAKIILEAVENLVNGYCGEYVVVVATSNQDGEHRVILQENMMANISIPREPKRRISVSYPTPLNVDEIVGVRQRVSTDPLPRYFRDLGDFLYIIRTDRFLKK